MPGGVAHPRSTKGVLNFTHLGNGASSVLVWLVSQPIESEHATTTRAMSGAPVVVVDGTAVDGTHPASPSDWLKTLPQLGAYTTGRTRGGGAKVAQWSLHVARLRSSLATLTATTFESDGEVAALIEPSVRRVLAVCVERNVAGPPDEGTPQCGIIVSIRR